MSTVKRMTRSATALVTITPPEIWGRVSSVADQIAHPEAVRLPRVPADPDTPRPSHFRGFGFTPAVLLSPIRSVLNVNFFVYFFILLHASGAQVKWVIRRIWSLFAEYSSWKRSTVAANTAPTRSQERGSGHMHRIAQATDGEAFEISLISQGGAPGRDAGARGRDQVATGSRCAGRRRWRPSPSGHRRAGGGSPADGPGAGAGVRRCGS